MVSVQTNMHRMLPTGEDARRLIYLSTMHYPSQPSISGVRDGALTVRRGAPDLGHQSQLPPQQQISRNHPVSKRTNFGHPSTSGPPSTSVSRRNARERKRVRLVNLGFSTLRDRVPQGSKNKKLSKVETLRAAIEYIRQLQKMLGLPDCEANDQLRAMMDENYGMDDCSSVASSEEVNTMQGPSGGSGDLSPASSHPSDYSLMSSPYTNPPSHDEHLLEMGLWFSFNIFKKFR